MRFFLEMIDNFSSAEHNKFKFKTSAYKSVLIRCVFKSHKFISTSKLFPIIGIGVALHKAMKERKKTETIAL